MGNWGSVTLGNSGKRPGASLRTLSPEVEGRWVLEGSCLWLAEDVSGVVTSWYIWSTPRTAKQAGGHGCKKKLCVQRSVCNSHML